MISALVDIYIKVQNTTYQHKTQLSIYFEPTVPIPVKDDDEIVSFCYCWAIHPKEDFSNLSPKLPRSRLRRNDALMPPWIACNVAIYSYPRQRPHLEVRDSYALRYVEPERCLRCREICPPFSGHDLPQAQDCDDVAPLQISFAESF